MSKLETNYIEYHLKLEDEKDLKEEMNLVGFNLLRSAFFLQFIPISKNDTLFKGINEKNSKIYINDEELNNFSLWYKFPKLGIYKVKIELTEKLKDLCLLFYKCFNIINIDLSHLDTSEVITMEGSYESCINLEEINLENINTEKLENLYGTFCACEKLKEIKGIENLNTKNVKNMRCFHGCKKLEKLNLQKWNTSNVSDMEQLFRMCEI